MKYYLIAGEASGDLHGANLMKAIMEQDPKAEFRFWGGDKMQAIGGTLVKHYRDLAFMGIQEVVLNLRTIMKNFTFCKKEITDYNPDVVVFIDYPGFNLRMARFAKEKGFKTVFYVSPTVWAWKKSRVFTIKKYVDRMMVILPFEEAFYQKYDYKAYFVGHPLLDELKEEKHISKEEFLTKNNLNNKPIIALLPGSRVQEISNILSYMVQLSANYPNHQFVIGGVHSVPKETYHAAKDMPVVYGQTHDLLRSADAALVTSGTATLETALIGTPQVVCYKTSTVTYTVARILVNVSYISLVNLIMDKEVVRELIQGDLTLYNLKTELDKTLSDEGKARMKAEYSTLRNLLGNSGASDKAAQVIHDFLSKNS
ncbi:MAG: lipid-A-disaccharide synthase [Bacteroidales bacterium]|nr:lipid-A-disaccharide synthase [Bacteroidales bacterium]